MKILYYSPHPNLNLNSFTGYGSHMRGTIQALELLGHEVVVFVAGGTVLSNKTKTAHKTGLIRMMPSWIKESIKDFLLLQQNRKQKIILKKLIKDVSPDLIYERGSYLMDAGVKVCAEKGVIHYLEVNAPFLQEKKEMEGSSFFLRKAKQMERYKSLNTNKLIVVSSALKKHFMQEFQVNADKIVICPNGINIADWKANAMDVSVIQEEIGFNSEHFVVGFVGSILPHHGVETLITAFKEVAQAHWRLLIVGDGGPLPALKKMANDLGIQNQVCFAGDVPFTSVKNYMKLFKVGVMPASNWYGSPVKIFEYGAMKIPVIAPDVDPVRDVMRDKQDGLLIRDTLGLQKALLMMSENKEDANKMAGTWHQKVMGNYTWLKITKGMLA
jgi:glycosyltransferase involved in cell wall biosynthesis